MPNQYCGNSRRSSMRLLSVIALINFFAIFVAAKPTAIVGTTSGPVQGEILTTVNSVNYAAFKGIPYAKPPLGNLRFKPSVAVDPWTETLNATVDGNKCIQLNIKTGRVVGSEDCLFINVQTPVIDLEVIPRKLKPVMVWIYASSFTNGSSSSHRYRPDYLLEKDVVYVAFNYRIGALGFLSLQHAEASGNAGLKDQVLALKWVKANIKKFGGDPNKVTIFGQSAGAVSVGCHVLSDASKGLFQAAISMSGSPLSPWGFNTPAKSLTRARQLGDLLGATSNNKEALLRTFLDAPAEKIVEATSKIALGILPFVPTIEDESIARDVFLTKCSVDKYRTGDFTKVPQLIGFVDRETTTFASNILPFTKIVDEAALTLDNYGLILPDNLVLAKDLINTSTDALKEIGNKVLEGVINVTTDALFIAPIDQTQQFLATRNGGKPVYYYHLSYYTAKSLHNIKSNTFLSGAGHGDDLAYIFYYPKANYSTNPRDPTRLTIDQVTTMWTNFAKHGNPTPLLAPLFTQDYSVGIRWPNSGFLGLSVDIGTELKIGFRPTNAYTKRIQAAGLPLLRDIYGCY